ncbi:Hypp3394 [Branchiostoma lanceolatum]|uniref:Hypp3394 protein n=1 Tax=Branchiostoma lanceolatum TaxID=7740 RepID=A0A8K0A218_BRALA|nr:Hypp3394 [Branchiostoma lanceolatum]
MSGQEKYKGVAFLTKSSDPKDGLAKVTLKVENATADPSWPLSVDTEVMVPPGTSVYNMLLQAFHNGAIKFQAGWYGNYWSHFIESINGLKEESTMAYHSVWSFEDGKGNAFDRGVDLISVYDGDTIVFRYFKYRHA